MRSTSSVDPGGIRLRGLVATSLDSVLVPAKTYLAGELQMISPPTEAFPDLGISPQDGNPLMHKMGWTTFDRAII